MSSIDNNELFEQYYQNEYDFNTSSLSGETIEDIKKFVREKRVDYNIAPMGTGIFSWILNQNSNIRFEMVKFDSDKIDGMLYIPSTGRERAYIILNSNKPLVNQIFTAAHEFYHYSKDYQKFKENPYICDFGGLKDINEMCASRFAAEFLLPEDALKREINSTVSAFHLNSFKELDFTKYAALSILLTVKYQIPLKAVIYRLFEEKYIEDINSYIVNYEFLKSAMKELTVFRERIEELYSNKNHYVITYSSIYSDMEKAYMTGNASMEDILADAKKLELDSELVNIFLEQNETIEEDIEDDDELFQLINEKRG